MSTTAAAVTVIAFFVFSVTAAYLLIRRAMRHEARHHQFLREQADTAREVDELELLYSLPDYDRASAAIDEGLSHLFEQLGPPPACDPAWAAGMERLWNAIRDEQHKEADDA